MSRPPAGSVETVLADVLDRLDAAERKYCDLEAAVGRLSPPRPSVSSATPLPAGWPTRKPFAPPQPHADLEDWLSAAEARPTDPAADPAHARRLESLGRVVGSVAHDFNNLLTLVCGYADLIAERVPPDDPLREPAEQIASAGRTAAALARQLLDLGRPARPAHAPFDLNAGVSGMERLLARVAGERATLRLALAPALTAVRADRTHVEQVLLNLVANARDALAGQTTEARQVTVRTAPVRVEPGRAGWPADRPAGDYATLSVTDTGCGIPDAVKARVFDPYFTTKGDAGTGLGLATVWQIAREAGGHVEIESAVGWGTTVRVFWPADPG